MCDSTSAQLAFHPAARPSRLWSRPVALRERGHPRRALSEGAGNPFVLVYPPDDHFSGGPVTVPQRVKRALYERR